MNNKAPMLRYEALSPVLVRAPLLPVEAYLGLPDDARRLLDDPLVRSAVSVGSPDLLAQSMRASSPRREQRMLLKLERYAIRMATRPTPYGMFAGVALADLGTQTTLRLAARPTRTQMRPDMAWLLAFVAQVEKRPAVRRALRVVANPEVSFDGGRAWLARSSPIDGAEPRAVAVRATSAVRHVLARSARPAHWSVLADELQTATGAAHERIDQLLTELWEQTFLLTELRPPLTHPSPARYVTDSLCRVPAAALEHAELTALLESMSEWDGLDLRERPSAGADIARRARLAVPDHHVACSQVDSAIDLSGDQLTHAVVRAATGAAELLLRLGPPPPAAGNHLIGYRNAFLGRYGTDREIPLLELLDPDRGLGPPSQYAAQPHLPKAPADIIRESTLRLLATEAAREGRLAIQLDQPTIQRLSRYIPTPATAPVSLDLAVLVLTRSTRDLDAGRFQLLVGPNLGAQAAGRNLGRFADLLGGRSRDLLAAAARAECAHDPADLHAELVYLPTTARATNVAVRPVVRGYEVAVGTMSGVDDEHTISVAELLVGLRDSEFYVRCPRLRGDLRVHAGHMLNPHMAPEVCRFLADVALGARALLAPFSWGPVADLPFLPRVEADDLILAPAQWRIDATTPGSILDPDSPMFPELLARWRSSWMVPRYVYLTQGDNRLLLDLERPTQIGHVRDELGSKRDRPVILQEALPGPEHAWVEGPVGHHICELVVSMVQPAPDASRPTVDGWSAPQPVAPPITRYERLRPPGTDWLYVKLYGPPDGEDDLLTGPIRELGDLATRGGLAQEWFFVRYADPDPHLRIRFRGDPGTLLRELLPRVTATAAKLIEDGSCLRMSIDTYEREIERYGGPAAIAVAESIFAADSEAVVETIRLARESSETMDRITLAVLSVDALLAALGLSAVHRVAWYRSRPDIRSASSTEHRLRHGQLRRLLGDPAAVADEPAGSVVQGLLQSRTVVIAPLAERLQAVERRGELGKPLDSILRSLVHMHCNRLLGAGTASERTVLGLLLRTYEGLVRSPLAPPDSTRRPGSYAGP